MAESWPTSTEQSELCFRKRKYPDLVDLNVKVKNQKLKTEENISVPFPNIVKDKTGLITNIINPNYGLAAISIDDIGIVGVLFDTCEFWHNGSPLFQQNLPLQDVVSEGDWVKLNAINVVANAQEDRNIVYLATDIVKAEAENDDWRSLVEIKDLGHLPKEKIDTFQTVTNYLKNVPLSNREKAMIKYLKDNGGKYRNHDSGIKNISKGTQETMYQTEKEEKVKVNIEIEKPILVPNTRQKYMVWCDKEKTPNYSGRDTLLGKYNNELLKSAQQKANITIPEGVPLVSKDKKGNVFENPNVAPLGSKKLCTFGGQKLNADDGFYDAKSIVQQKANMTIPKGVPLLRKSRKGNFIENPNVAPLGSKRQCTFGGQKLNGDDDFYDSKSIVQQKAQMTIHKGVPLLNKDKKGTVTEIPSVPPHQKANMTIPKGVPLVSKDKKGNILENPNVAPLGSKMPCTFGGQVSNASIELQKTMTIRKERNIPKGVPLMSKYKKGTHFENPNVAPLGSKRQCTFGVKLDEVSIIKWHK